MCLLFVLLFGLMEEEEEEGEKSCVKARNLSERPRFPGLRFGTFSAVAFSVIVNGLGVYR